MNDFVVDDPVVDFSEISKFNMAFMMHFFVQHKSLFGFPRLRLQDLYNRVILGNDLVPLSDLVARILRFLRKGDPSICISTVDEALDAFIGEKRTPHRQELQTARSGRAIANLDAPSRALLLEHLIECVYDEIPTLSIETTTQTVTNESTEDSVLLNAGRDASGSTYYYLDDLRLYRETPKEGLSSHWSVAVGASADQWKSFIDYLGQTSEEIELAHFLKTDIFPLLQGCFESVSDLTDELNPSRLMDKELSELSTLRQQRGLPPLPSTTSPSTCLPIDNGGSSAGSNSGNSTSTCPLTPPNGTPSALPGVSQSLRPSTSASIQETSLKTSNTAPNTPSTGSWQPDGSLGQSSTNNPTTALGYVQHPHSVGSLSSTSPSQQDAKTKFDSSAISGQGLQNSPLRRPSSGPMPVEPSLQPEGGQPHSAPSSVGDDFRKVSMTPNQAFPNKLQSVSELNTESGAISNMGASSANVPIGGNSNRSIVPPPPTGSLPMGPGPFGPASHALVFTTDMANDAAVKCQRNRMRATAYHTMHPLVQHYMLQHGMIPGSAAAAAAAASAMADCGVTQEQLENRKTKMAQLERIHSKLTKGKAASSAQGVAALQQQQQQMYAAAVAAGQIAPPPPPCTTIPPMQQHDNVHPPTHPGAGMAIDSHQQMPRGMMINRPDEREFDRIAWMQQQQQQQRKQHSLQPPMGDPNGVHFQYPGSVDQGGVPPPGGPPVLVVPPNNACGYPSNGPPNKFCIPAPPPYKRPYPSDLAGPDPQFWESQQQAMMEQQQQQQQQMMLMQQQQQQQQSVLPAPMGCGRTSTGRGGVSKKRKSGNTGANRAAPRPSQTPAMPPFTGGPQRISQPGPQPPACGLKASGFGTVPIGPPRGSVAGSFQSMSSDPMNGAYANPNYRGPGIGSVNMGMMDQSQYPPVPVGPGSGPLPPTSLQQPLSGGYTHPTDSIASSSSSSTQHLTSASLASLARLSQLSGTEGPYCPPPSIPSNSTMSCPPSATQQPPSGFSRMISAPDMLGFSGGPGPGMMSNPDPDPNSLYAMSSVSTNPSTPGNAGGTAGPPYQQTMPIPQTGGQQSGFHPSPHSQQQQPGGTDVAATVSRCLTPNSAPPICPPTSTSPSTPTATNSLPPSSASAAAAPQSASQQSQPGQFNVQPMNYPHMNGVNSGNSQFHAQFMQQQQQQPPSRPFYGSSNGGCPPPPNQRVEPRNPQPPTNVQITPKTPHTIQYLPTSTAAPGTTATVSSSSSAGPYPQQSVGLGGNGKSRVPSGQKLQSPTHNQVAPNAVLPPAPVPATVPTPSAAGQARQQQRGPTKMDHSQALSSAQLPMSSVNAQSSMGLSSSAGAPNSSEIPGMSDGMYSTGPKYPAQGFPMSVADASQAQQPDNTNPFDFPQGATPYPNANAPSQPRSIYRDPSIHLQYPPPSNPAPTYRVESDQLASAALNTAISASKNVLAPSATSQQIHIGGGGGGEMIYPQQQQRWQQQQQAQMIGGGSEFYMQQAQSSNGSNSGNTNSTAGIAPSGGGGGVMMMPPPPPPAVQQQGPQSQQQAFYMPQPGVVPSHLHQQLQSQAPPPPPTQASHSRPYPALL